MTTRYLYARLPISVRDYGRQEFYLPRLVTLLRIRDLPLAQRRRIMRRLPSSFFAKMLTTEMQRLVDDIRRRPLFGRNAGDHVIDAARFFTR